MKTTIDFLNDLKAKYSLRSNYALAKFLGQTDTDIARWMKGKNTLGDESALKVADLLEVDPAYVMACVHAEREKNTQVRKVWERIATLSIGVGALVIVLTALPYVTLPNADVGIVAVPNNEALYIM